MYVVLLLKFYLSAEVRGRSVIPSYEGLLAEYAVEGFPANLQFKPPRYYKLAELQALLGASQQIKFRWSFSAYWVCVLFTLSFFDYGGMDVGLKVHDEATPSALEATENLKHLDQRYHYPHYHSLKKPLNHNPSERSWFCSFHHPITMQHNQKSVVCHKIIACVLL